ncbi:hypothetical protein VTI74DRAFT_428 [Chaetomium olivicolor]
MASLGNLPPEILGHIADDMARGYCERSLAALAATCCDLCTLIVPYLYYDIVIGTRPFYTGLRHMAVSPPPRDAPGVDSDHILFTRNIT